MRKLPALPAVPSSWLIVGGALGCALLYVALNGAKKTGENIGGAAVNLADGVLSGAVQAVGDRVGVPRTDAERCAAAKDAGDTWAASFACPASDFVSFWWNK